jgi:crossover junction endodeoxyribonuclease RuvC
MPATAIGLDLSLTGAGVGLADYNTLQNEPYPPAVYTYGRDGHKNEPLLRRHDRIKTITHAIRAVITSSDQVPSLACVEEPPYGATGGSGFDRAGLWWDVYGMLRDLGIPTIAVNVAKVKKYALGKGSGKGTDKDQVMAAAIRRYPEVPISNNNESDAWILTCIAKRLLGEPLELSLPQTHLAAMEGLVLP